MTYYTFEVFVIMSSEDPNPLYERIASVETAVQYLTQAQVERDRRFDRLEDKVDKLADKFNQLFIAVIIGLLAIVGAILASNFIGG